MSHFTVMVIGENPEEQLKPYDESIEVEEYIKNEVTEEEKQRMLNYYIKEGKLSKDVTFEEAYKKYGYELNYGSYKKDENGVWQEYSTYNQNSKWDWHLLGGRWSGLIKLKEGKNGVIGESGAFNNHVGIDQAKKGDIANFDELCTFAIVKDGQWFERGQMGFWGIVHDEKDDDKWEEEFKKLIDGLPEETLISIYDCHI